MSSTGENWRRRKNHGFNTPKKRGRINRPCAGSHRTKAEFLLGYLTQKVIDPVSSPPEVTLIEEAQEEQETIASLVLDVSCSMQVDERYKLTYMIADRLGDLFDKG